MVENRMVNQKDDSEKYHHGFWIVISGLFVMTLALLISATRWPVASDTTSVLTAFGGVVGTLVGAFFGVAVGSEGKKQADKRADEACRTATKLALYVDPEKRDAALKSLGLHSEVSDKKRENKNE